MTWVKIDDSFPDHPKIIGLSDRAFRLHIQGLCYCGKYLTDGFIPYAAVNSMVTEPEYKPTDELESAGLWIRCDKGFEIHDYLEHQSSKSEVVEKKETTRARVKRHRESKLGNAVTNAYVTGSEYREQSTDNRVQSSEIEITTTNNLPLPRVKSARDSVYAIQKKLSDARADGINAWNLSRLVEDEWDKLHNANEIGGCIALTAWYVSELQTRPLTTSEIGRIGQMTKRFGRIALLAIDEAASKDLTDLVSYAYRVAQNLYKEKAGK
jgi:hypothetical protein